MRSSSVTTIVVSMDFLFTFLILGLFDSYEVLDVSAIRGSVKKGRVTYLWSMIYISGLKNFLLDFFYWN